MRSRKRSVLWVAISVAAVLGCSPKTASHALDARQSVDPNALVKLPLPVLTFDEPVPSDAPKRIVSMIPSVTELLFTLGLGDRVVARDDWSDWPPEAETRPALGNQQGLSVERVADLHPDLVIFWAHLPDKVNRLRELFRLQVITPGTETRAEVFDGIRMVAEACKVPGRGRVLLRRIEEGLLRVKTECAKRPRFRTLIVLDRTQAITLPGRDSFLQELFDTWNLENVAAGLDAGRWPAVSIERVLDWNPDLILDLSLGVAATDAQVADARAFWSHHSSLEAVRSGRVVVLNAGVLVRPGPRLAAVAEELARIVDVAK